MNGVKAQKIIMVKSMGAEWRRDTAVLLQVHIKCEYKKIIILLEV